MNLLKTFPPYFCIITTACSKIIAAVLARNNFAHNIDRAKKHATILYITSLK